MSCYQSILDTFSREDFSFFIFIADQQTVKIFPLIMHLYLRKRLLKVKQVLAPFCSKDTMEETISSEEL